MFSQSRSKSFLLIFFLFFTCQTANGQIIIEGLILDSLSNQPIPYVTAYLANTSIGANSDEQGKFRLSNVPPGTYELVFSLIGYEKRSKRIKPEPNTTLTVHIKLLPQSKELSEVVVTSQKNKDWERCFKQFKKDFLGYTPNSNKCTIVNPELLHFDYDKKEKKITGSSNGFIIIENKALGYKLRYELNEYLSNMKKGFSSYYGNAFYEELPAKNKRQKEYWAKKREIAYHASFQHFVHALLTRKLVQEGFQVLNSSINKPENILTEENLLRATQFPNIMSINYKDTVLINYLNEPEDNIYKALYRTYSLGSDSYQTSVLKFTSQTIVASNGYIYNPLSVIKQGYWAYESAAELLPLNFIPLKQANK